MMRIDTDVIELRWRRHAIFQPGDGTRYVITTIPDPHGGIFVIVHGNTLYRWYKDGQITYLGGKHEENKYTKGQPQHGAHLAEDLQRFVEMYGPESIAGCFVEPIAGSTGTIVPPIGYLERLREICDKYGIVLVLTK